MFFERIVIIGLGLIGGSLAAAIKRKSPKVTIIGVDHASILKKALEHRIIDTGYEVEQLKEGLVKADLVILATPIHTIIRLLKEIGRDLKPDTLVSDVGSTKQAIVDTASRYLPDGIHFIGGHPMTGSERSGVENADPLLFENAAYVLTRSASVPKAYVDAFISLISSIGARIAFLDARQHDEVAAAVSHLPQLLAVTLMQTAAELGREEPMTFELAAGGFRDMTRIASSPFVMWRDIISSNCSNIRKQLARFRQQLEKVEASLEAAELESLFLSSAQNREKIPGDRRGFLSPNYEATILVEDKPGVIASIALLLAKSEVNIKDIEILKVREGDAGTLKLGFQSAEQRSQALSLLQEKGYTANARD